MEGHIDSALTNRECKKKGYHIEVPRKRKRVNRDLIDGDKYFLAFKQLVDNSGTVSPFFNAWNG